MMPYIMTIVVLAKQKYSNTARQIQKPAALARSYERGLLTSNSRHCSTVALKVVLRGSHLLYHLDGDFYPSESCKDESDY